MSLCAQFTPRLERSGDVVDDAAHCADDERLQTPVQAVQESRRNDEDDCVESELFGRVQHVKPESDFVLVVAQSYVV